MVQDAHPAERLTADGEGRGRPPRPRLPLGLQARERTAALACVAPWLVGFLAFTLAPMLLSLAASFTDYNVIQPGSTHWVGGANYQEAVHDSVLIHSVLVTIFYAVIAVPLDVGVGLVLALLLSSGIRGLAGFRTIFLLPVMIAGTGGGSVAVALLWLWIFQPRFGLLNYVLGLVHIPAQLWIYSPRLVIPSLALISLWGVGQTMLIFLAALHGLPRDVLHAAEVDGATAWRRFWRVTLPLLSPAIMFNLLLDMIAALQSFTSAYVITQGGPGDSSLFYVLYLYRNAFLYFRMGYASALAWLLLAGTLLISVFIFRTGRSWVFYQARAAAD